MQRRRRDCHSTCLHADFHFPGQASFFDDRRREPDTAQIADAHRACFYGTLPSVSTMYPRLSGGMVSRVRLENTTGWRPVSRGLAPKCYLTLSYDHAPRRRTHRRARTDRGRVVVVHKNRQKGQDSRVIARAWKAPHRARKDFHRLSAVRPPQAAVVAFARELVWFLWAVMRDVPIATRQAP